MQLHITNGDSAADIISTSDVGGDVLPWRDPMHHGPFPTHLTLDALEGVRAQHLSCFGTGERDITRSFRQRNETLMSASQYDEVILWFEHDLLDQLQLLEILSWFASNEVGSTILTMICINHYPGIANFRGIGQLSSQDIQTLLPTRKPVVHEQLQLAQTAWLYFGLENPEQLQQLICAETSSLPFLRGAVNRHFQDYPWVSDGLTRTERQILNLVSSGVVVPEEVFVKNMECEQELFIGDWYTFQIIDSLCAGKCPLILRSEGGRTSDKPTSQRTLRRPEREHLSLSESGSAVLAGAAHAQAMIARDHWLGGVHFLSGKPMWMWNPVSSTLEWVSPQTE